MAKTPTPAQSTRSKTPAKTEAPKTYTLTDKGKALAPRQGTHRAIAWSALTANLDKPDAELVAAINEAKAGSITGRSLIGWAVKSGLLAG